MASVVAKPKLFSPIQVGRNTLKHRVVLPPLTRNRANAQHVHGDLAVQYYEQRASVPGTLLVSEATFIAARAGGMRHVPGVWNEAQVEAWRKVTDAVHAKGSFIYCQLWALGRAASPEVLQSEDPSLPYVSASAIPLKSNPSHVPRPLSVQEIQEYIELYATAASNAIKAGFDGVEIHGANGYLIDQFLQDVSNKRTDEYGGSIENRVRFALGAVKSVVEAIGADRTAIRLSPWGTFQDMRMEDPIPTFTHLVTQLSELYPDLAFLHVVEPGNLFDPAAKPPPGESNGFIRRIWAPRPVVSTTLFNRESALDHAEKTGDLVGFGRNFISNPDLPFRLEKNLPLSPYDHKTFYAYESPKGYVDYPFSAEFEQAQAQKAAL